MAEGTAEAARTMRSEGAIENEAGSGELLDTAKVNSTATAGGAGWEERTFAGTMSWEEMVEKKCAGKLGMRAQHVRAAARGAAVKVGTRLAVVPWWTQPQLYRQWTKRWQNGRRWSAQRSW